MSKTLRQRLAQSKCLNLWVPVRVAMVSMTTCIHYLTEDDGGHNVLRPAAPQVDDKSGKFDDTDPSASNLIGCVDVEMVKASEESSSIEHPVGLGSTGTFRE